MTVAVGLNYHKNHPIPTDSVLKTYEAGGKVIHQLEIPRAKDITFVQMPLTNKSITTDYFLDEIVKEKGESTREDYKIGLDVLLEEIKSYY